MSQVDFDVDGLIILLSYPEVVVSTLPEPPADLTKWDLSISSLLKVSP